MKSKFDTDFGSLAISEGFATPEQVNICQRIVDTFDDEDPRKRLDVIMTDRGYITPEQGEHLTKMLGITVVLCPHCNTRFTEADQDLREVIDCKHCGKRVEHQGHNQVDTQQTSLTSSQTLTAFQEQQTCDIYVGKLLGGKYEIIEKIAVGGWSTIYKAKRKLLNIDDIVAVKILHISLSDNPQDIKRFYNEAATIRELRHPNAIHLYDFDRDANGTIYMAMEFVHGRNLKETIKSTGPFDVTRMLNIIIQVCDVISAAHKHPKKIIHRDITPQNIMLSKIGELDDFVKVLDFGIAKLRTHDNVSLTGSIVGTPLYMAPEQWRGECDERTDIYSLGIIMYEMLTGETPFKGDQITLMNKHLNEKPRPFRRLHKKLKIPKDIENIVFHCLEKNKEKRPQSIDELKSLLQRGKSNTGIKLTNYSKGSLLIIISTFLSILLALFLFYLPKKNKNNTTIPTPVVHFRDIYKEIDEFKKMNDSNQQISQDNSFEVSSGEEKNNYVEQPDTSSIKLSSLPLDYNNETDLNHTNGKKLVTRYKKYWDLDKVVDNIQKYDINKTTTKAPTKQDPKEIVKKEIQKWLQEYKKAWEKGDIETLKELGHISSEKEANKLRQHYLYVHDVRVSIREEVIEVNSDNSQAIVSFVRADEWTDERGNRQKKVLPRIIKILHKENNMWKITKKTEEPTKQPITSKYRKILDNITTSYSDLLKEIDSRFLK